jgi:hypothetical protein
MRKRMLVVGSVLACIAASPSVLAQNAANMTFFVTSAGPGKGGDLGGLEGADRHCQSLAQAAGAGNRTWRAYLSADAAGGRPAVNAKDRIGSGPWTNAKGIQIAANVAELHGDANKIDKQTGLSEKGTPINARGDTPNMHDILTGSNADGTLAAGQTCNNWTSSSAGSAIVGHHDRQGLRDDAPSKSWNASHPSRSCSQEDLRATGGNGFFYCFATR